MRLGINDTRLSPHVGMTCGLWWPLHMQQPLTSIANIIPIENINLGVLYETSKISIMSEGHIKSILARTRHLTFRRGMHYHV